MKKIKGTRYAYIGKSYYPALDELEEKIKAQVARLDEIEKAIKKLKDE